jgi:DNA-binding MarR family transcriptional regulator
MTPFSSKPGHLIRRLHQISTHIFAQRVQEGGFDLTPVQFAALDALRLNEGIDQARLADAVAKDRATIGAVVDRLVQKGLVARRVSEKDRRAKVLSLTREGAALLAAIRPLVERLQRDILRGLDDEEYERFVELAAKAARAAAQTPDE